VWKKWAYSREWFVEKVHAYLTLEGCLDRGYELGGAMSAFETGVKDKLAHFFMFIVFDL
jgi:hypothetical protein